MKRYIVIAVGIMLIIVVALRLLAPKQLPVSPPFASNIREPYLISEQDILFFSGSSFVKFNTSSGQSRPLTGLYTLPTVTAIRWSPKGALIKAGGYSRLDQLYPILRQQQLPVSRSYWWKVAFQTGQISLIQAGPDVAIDAIWSGEEVFFLSSRQELWRETSPTAISNLKDANSLVTASQSRVLFITTDGSLSRQQGQKTDILARDVHQAGASGNTILYTASPNRKEGGSTAGELRWIDSSGATTVLDPGFSGVIERSPDLLAYQPAKAGLKLFWPQEDKVEKFLVKSKEPLLRLVAKNDRLAATGEDDLAYLVAAKHRLKLQNPSRLQKATYNYPFYLIYDDKKKQYSAYILANPYRQNQQQLLHFIQGQQLDPYQLNIRWYPDDGITLN